MNFHRPYRCAARIALLALATLSTSLAESPFPPATSANLEKAAQLYQRNCLVCHGASLQGDGPAGAALDPPPANLSRRASYKRGSDKKSISRTITSGVPNTGMIGWEGHLTPAQIRLISVYIESRSK